jgi:hypothetical protein
LGLSSDSEGDRKHFIIEQLLIHGDME